VIRLTKEARDVVERAAKEAHTTASRSVEAEHILLALAAREGTAAQRILASAGLEREALLAAVEKEFEQSLAYVGVPVGEFDLKAVADSSSSRLGWAASARLVLERALAVGKRRCDNRLEPTHLLLGVLGAKAGTLPRMFAMVGVDVADLTKRAEEALPAPG
jgi:ATP-dependent Clp protease ATP-binding subunit ClpA